MERMAGRAEAKARAGKVQKGREKEQGRAQLSPAYFWMNGPLPKVFPEPKKD